MAYERALPKDFYVIGPNGGVINRVEKGDNENSWDDLDVRERKRRETAAKLAQRWYDNYYSRQGETVSIRSR